MKYTKTKKMFLAFVIISFLFQLIQYVVNMDEFVKEIDQHLVLYIVSVVVFLFLWGRMAFDNYKGKQYLLKAIIMNLIISSIPMFICFCVSIRNIEYLNIVSIFLGMFSSSISYYFDIKNLSDAEIYKKRKDNDKIVV